MARLRVGIDVGGTFTDVVAIDPATRSVVARVKVPTTHTGEHGVADGIVLGLERLLCEHDIKPESISFIAHATTQATNALLEGDVARVGVLGLLRGFATLQRLQLRFANVALATNADFAPAFTFVRAGDVGAMRAAVDAFVAAGVQALAVSQAFGVDDSQSERGAVAYARERGIGATAGHEVSAQYGLRARTRTAALNAAILPTMLRTARTTAQAVTRAKIEAPLMVMRSDGGVMHVQEIERRPILTLLSGPAAGVAGALLHERVSDGIFIEVGGTSSDCSAIRAGRPQLRAARIGNHRTMLRTLDVRTLAIAGGSMLRMRAHELLDVGPRSAHIAGARYACFVAALELEGAQVDCIAPTSRDASEYVVLRTRDGGLIAPTPTCAANLLGFVPEGDFARASAESAERAFALVGEALGMSAQACARRVLEIAAGKLQACIARLMQEYAFPLSELTLVGGGGGAAALVPFAAQRMGLPFRLARDAEVISPIGVALALLRESVERTIVDPAPHEILALRREAGDAVIAAGADPARIEVHVEIDAQRNRVRAVASGAMGDAAALGQILAPDERARIVAASLRVEAGALHAAASTGALEVFAYGDAVRVVDERGVVRFGASAARVIPTNASQLERILRDEIEATTRFGDVGRALPDAYILHGARIADFCGLLRAEQIVALAREEIGGCDPAAPIVVILVPSRV